MTEQAVGQTLKVDAVGGVAWLRLNRPERLNAVNTEMRRALIEALKQVERDDSVRVVVLTGEGRAFCSGADIRELGERPPGLDIAAEYSQVLTRLRSIPKPVLCAINGVAAGIGASFAMACDIRLASPESSFVLAFVLRGLAVDGGATWMLPRLIGRGKALEMFYTGRPLGAEEAERFGLVNQVAPAAELLARTQELAEALARGPRAALGAIKRSVNYSEEAGFEDAHNFEFALQGVQLAGPEFKEGLAAFVEKRPPEWAGEG